MSAPQDGAERPRLVDLVRSFRAVSYAHFRREIPDAGVLFFLDVASAIARDECRFFELRQDGRWVLSLSWRGRDLRTLTLVERMVCSLLKLEPMQAVRRRELAQWIDGRGSNVVALRLAGTAKG